MMAGLSLYNAVTSSSPKLKVRYDGNTFFQCNSDNQQRNACATGNGKG